MGRPRAPDLAWGLLAFLALAGMPAGGQVIPVTETSRIAALAPSGVLAGGYSFTDIEVDVDRVTFVLTRTADGQVVGRLWLLPPSEARPGDRRSRSFVVRARALDPSPRVEAALAAAVARVQLRDPGGLLVPRPKPLVPTRPPPAALSPADGARTRSDKSAVAVAAPDAGFQRLRSRLWGGPVTENPLGLAPATRRAIALGQALFALALLLGSTVFLLGSRSGEARRGPARVPDDRTS